MLRRRRHQFGTFARVGNGTEVRSAEMIEYQQLPTQQAKARWLLDRGVTARLTIDPDKLEPAYQAFVGEWSFRGYFNTADEAIANATTRLKEIAKSPETHSSPSSH